jgi:hypothetical protein
MTKCRLRRTFPRRGIRVALAILLVASPASYAATITGGPEVLTLTCTRITATGGATIVLNRDVTGFSDESVVLNVSDGNGVQLTVAGVSSKTGASFPFSTLVGDIPYDTAPTRNPITARVYSPGGNGLPEQTLMVTVGACALAAGYAAPIPTLSQWALVVLAMAIAGIAWTKRRRFFRR